jgi:radical SAM superfamily enzyme
MDVSDEYLKELMKEKEEEEKEEEIVEEDNNPVKIVAVVIASLPHSPSKTFISTMEIFSSSKILSTKETSIT